MEYSAIFHDMDKRFCYAIDKDLFVIRVQGEKVYYGNYEFDKECITNRDRMFDCPQNLREEEMFEVPQWAANKVVYQIFPSRFAATQPVDKKLWYKAPITPMDDLHGNLRGIIEHLDDMKDLGIDVVYNHTGREFFAFQDILEKGEKSKYLDWYFIDELPPKGEWGEIPNFKCFGYYGGMPKLNLTSVQG